MERSTGITIDTGSTDRGCEKVDSSVIVEHYEKDGQKNSSNATAIRISNSLRETYYASLIISAINIKR